MLESLALVLLVAMVLAAVALLFGFVGCDLVFTLEDPPPFEKAFETVFTEQKSRENRTVVVRIEPIRLFRSGSKVRVVLQRPANGDLNVRALYISHAAETGDPYDSASDPTLVASDLLLSVDPANGNVELDPVAFAIDQTRPLLIAIDVGDAGRLRDTENVPSTEGSAFVAPPDVFEASLADRSSGYAVEDRFFLVQRIDVQA